MKEILDCSTGKRRVLIVDLGDGRYSWEEERFSDDEWEQCWVAVPHYPYSVCDSAVTAEREAQGRVSWLGN